MRMLCTICRQRLLMYGAQLKLLPGKEDRTHPSADGSKVASVAQNYDRDRVLRSRRQEAETLAALLQSLIDQRNAVLAALLPTRLPSFVAAFPG